MIPSGQSTLVVNTARELVAKFGDNISWEVAQERKSFEYGEVEVVVQVHAYLFGEVFGQLAESSSFFRTGDQKPLY